MNQYESEYQSQKRQKNASIKKIEDEYSAMKAALLSSMDSEEEISDEDQNFVKSLEKNAPSQQTELIKSDKNPLKSVSGHPKSSQKSPSFVKNSITSHLDQPSNLPHGKNDQIVIDSQLKLGSRIADNVKHEDVLVRKMCHEDPTAIFNQGRIKNVSILLIIAIKIKRISLKLMYSTSAAP